MNLLLLAAVLSIPPVNAGVPNREPSMAASGSSTLVAFASGTSIYIAKSNDAGKTFAAPVKLATVNALAVGRHRGPHIVIIGNTIVVTAIAGNTVASGPHAHGLPADGDLRAWRSEDAGQSWSAPAVVNDVTSSAREGLHAMTVSPSGVVAVAWLDLRAKGTRLYGALSKDRGATWGKNVLLYESTAGTICQCCRPSLAVNPAGEFVIMFRNWDGAARDMYLANWNVETGVTAASKLGQGSWNLNACPMDGGGVAATKRGVTTAWRRDKNVYLTSASNTEMLEGEGKDVALAATSFGDYVSWTSPAGIEAVTPKSAAPMLIGKEGAFSTLLALPNDRVAAAWEHAGAIEFTVLP